MQRAPLSHLLLSLMGDPSSKPVSLWTTCRISGAEPQPCHCCTNASPWPCSAFHSWPHSLGSYFSPSLAQTKLLTLGPAFSTGLGPKYGPNFTVTASTTGTGILAMFEVPITYFIKSLPIGVSHCPVYHHHTSKLPCTSSPTTKIEKRRFSTEGSWEMPIIRCNYPTSYGKHNERLLGASCFCL